jgi:hypothetical protein
LLFFRSPGRRIKLRTAMPARARRMTRQPSLDPDEPGSVLVDGGVTSGVPVSPPTPPVSDWDVPVEVVPVEVVPVWVDWVESDTSEVSVVTVEVVLVAVVSDTPDVSVSVEVVEVIDSLVVDVVPQPHFGPLCAATVALGMSSAAPSSRTAPSQPRRRIVMVLEWDPPEFLSVMSLNPRVGG